MRAFAKVALLAAAKAVLRADATVWKRAATSAVSRAASWVGPMADPLGRLKSDFWWADQWVA